MTKKKKKKKKLKKIILINYLFLKFLFFKINIKKKKNPTKNKLLNHCLHWLPQKKDMEVSYTSNRVTRTYTFIYN